MTLIANVVLELHTPKDVVSDSGDHSTGHIVNEPKHC